VGAGAARTAQRIDGHTGEVGHVYVIVRKGGKLVWLPDDVAGDRESARLRSMRRAPCAA
jgi:hypothetical protein